MRRKIAIAAALAATLVGAAACGDEPTPRRRPARRRRARPSRSGSWSTPSPAGRRSSTTRTPGSPRRPRPTSRSSTSSGPTTSPSWTPTLAGTDVPDVVELGNTEMPKYVFNGAFAEIDKSRFENSAHLAAPACPTRATLDGKTYCVPYYAGARVLIYRTDLLRGRRPQAADDATPSCSPRPTSSRPTNAADPNFAAFYMPGAYWYAAMSWVYGEGGADRQEGRTTSGSARSPSRTAQAGLQKWADLVRRTTRRVTRPRTRTTRTRSSPRVTPAFLYGNGWEVGAVQSQRKDPNDPNSPMVDTAVKGKVAAVPLPGATAGKGLPSFLGGSAIGVTGKSQNQALAAGVDQVLHRHQVAGGPDRQGRAAQRDLAARQGRRGQGQRGDRARRQEQLVRADGAEVGRRRERQRPAADAA